MRSTTMIASSLVFATSVALMGCPGDDCERTATCESGSGAANAGGSGATGGSGQGGDGTGGTGTGTGGTETGSGGGGGGPLPLALGAGLYHTCFADSGNLSCWGKNDVGQLGQAAPTSSPTPLGVNLQNVVDVAAGVGHTCALVSDGTVWCWGEGNYGELGDGSQQSSPDPVKVIALDNVKAIEAGDDHTCALLGDGTARCWGLNGDGQLGDGTTTALSSSPVEVAIQGIEHLADSATCAILMGGSLWCWGNGNPNPTQIPTINDAVDACRGDFHTCVVRESGEVWCWGNNDHNQLGYDGVPQGGTSAPTEPVTDITTAKEVECGYDHTCARIANGTVRCWGEPGSGQLGNGDETHTEEAWQFETPVGLDQVIELALGYEHSCALREGGNVWCWGANSSGQAGVGDASNQLVPVAVQGL